MTTKCITPDFVMSLGPCYDREHIEELFDGRQYVYPKTVLASKRIKPEDKIWLLARPEFLGEKSNRLLAADYAEHVLHLYDEKHPDDDRVRKCIEVVRQYACGKASDEELDVARDAAWVARDAAWVARVAAGDAARVAEQKWQLEKLREYLRGGKMKKCPLELVYCNRPT